MAKEYCIFSLGQRRLGAEVTSVREIMPLAEMTPVPLAHPSLRGVVNLRGRALSIFDVAVFLGAEPGVQGGSVLVFEKGDNFFGIQVGPVDTGIVFTERLQAHPHSSLYPALDGVGQYHKINWEEFGSENPAFLDSSTIETMPQVVQSSEWFETIHLDRLRMVMTGAMRYDEILT